VAAKVEEAPPPAPTPTPAPIAPPRPVVAPPKPVVAAGPGNYDGLLQAHFGSAWTAARAVMMCESGSRADAIGDGHLTYWQNGVKYGFSVGLMQIRYLPGRPDPSLLLNPEFNIRHAAGMWKAQGYRFHPAWTCARKVGVA
jgi:hypothetical protein